MNRWVSTCLVLSLCASSGAHAQAPSTPAVVCTSIGLDPARRWTFEPTDDTWRVTHTLGETARTVTLVLPRATATFTDEAITLRSRTANGGIDVTLNGTWTHATLDAYINYELEVNVDASLTPEIDDIATEAPTGVRCGRVG